MKQPPLHERRHQMLTVEQLNKLTTKRLLGVLKVARAVEQAEQHRVLSRTEPCLHGCGGWYEENIVKPTAHLTAYKNRIKKILADREHVKK